MTNHLHQKRSAEDLEICYLPPPVRVAPEEAILWMVTEIMLVMLRTNSNQPELPVIA